MHACVTHLSLNQGTMTGVQVKYFHMLDLYLVAAADEVRRGDLVEYRPKITPSTE